ncbi:hypothetical protein V9T40_005100 [Parthenolecanium corni]|uniref:Uncharacterized protein n=1 Tax=Parthenolecanium corni TaxID=536013 RepID=A0AAN9TDJ8_9HEMI
MDGCNKLQFTKQCTPKIPIEYVRLGDVELNDAADGTKHTDISIEKIIPHPEFSRNPIINDLALIRLKVPVNYTDNIRPICLLTQPKYEATKESYEYNKKFVNIIGYTYVQADGSTNHELKSWFTTIMNQTECNQRYATQRFALIDENLICIASSGKDTCEITMGGALFFENRTEHRFYLRGISSYGASCFLSNPPDVFTKVTHFVDWIVQVTGSACINPSRENGLCIPIRQCKTLMTLMREDGKDPRIIRFLKQSKCGGDGKNPQVCCPDV